METPRFTFTVTYCVTCGKAMTNVVHIKRLCYDENTGDPIDIADLECPNKKHGWDKHLTHKIISCGSEWAMRRRA